MFNNIIYFIVVLFIYHFAYTSKPPQNTLIYTLGMLLVSWLAFAGYCRWVFHRLLDCIRKDAGERGPRTGEYQRLILRLSILAMLLFALDVNLLYLKYWLQFIPGLKYLSVLQGATALAIFLAFLGTIWYFAHPAYVQIFRTGISKGSFVISNFRFNIPILFPWLVLSSFHDLLNLTPWGGPESFLNRPLGQLLYVAVLLIILMIFLPLFIQIMWGCRPFEPSSKVRALKAFLQENGMRYRDLLRWPIFEGRMMTAGIMGIVPRYRYILITDALMEILSLDELKAVVAHEMGHARYRHLLFYVLYFFGFMVLFIGLFNLEEPGLYSLLILYVMGKFSITVSDHTFWLIYGTTILATLLIYFRYVMGFFMRNFERQADLYSALTMGSPGSTISSLEKIALLSGKSRELPSWHHFSIKERVEYLWRTWKEPLMVRKHHRFVALSTLIYMVAVIGLGYLFYFSHAPQALGHRLVSMNARQQLIRDPNNMEYLQRLAMVYHEMGELNQAVKTYERIISLDPSQAVALNNLAWILLTATDESLRDRERSLRLAKRAVAMDRSPIFLDTLAEAYFSNGYEKEAVETIKEAIAKAKENRNYYKQQLKKFLSGRKEG